MGGPCWRGKVRASRGAGERVLWGRVPALTRTPSPEPPTVRVSGKEADGLLTLYCRAYGFYPRPIAVSWLKGGEVRDQETERGSVAPNSDGTYYTWASIEARPEEKDEYRCRVEHASLPEPGLFAWGEPGGLGHGERWAGLVALPLLTALTRTTTKRQVSTGGRSGSSRCPVLGPSRGSRF
uniref:Ig-like domain-containing protein n=1 Tax=Strix occidentalis caurina TaxID=311401 RepID=A0A8D0KSQ7_STROC